MNIELLYFEGCPSWQSASANLITALESLGVSSEVHQRRIDTDEDAVSARFTGSPTIRVDGVDLFPITQNHYGLGCRLYLTPEGPRGWPTVAMLRDKLAPLVHAPNDGD
jgi:hypothetical protein